jgi:hypothetical protein
MFFSISKQELFCHSNFTPDQVFLGQMQNNNSKTIVISVTLRSQLRTALYTVGRKTASSKIRLQNSAYQALPYLPSKTHGEKHRKRCQQLGLPSQQGIDKR